MKAIYIQVSLLVLTVKAYRWNINLIFGGLYYSTK
jgi:hypothetical protein